MTPKEKAQKIHDKYYFEIWNNVSFDDESEVYESAKQCALLCVDEIIKHNGRYYLLNGGELVEKIYRKENRYLFEVKQEIEKL